MKTIDTPSSPILIVDDEEYILKSTSRLLRSAGINNVVCCRDSREVMGILSSQPICAVLLDLSMPHVMGGELLPQIVALHPDVPVVIITGHPQDVSDIHLADLSIEGYIEKPISLQAVLNTLKYLVGE